MNKYKHKNKYRYVTQLEMIRLDGPVCRGLFQLPHLKLLMGFSAKLTVYYNLR